MDILRGTVEDIHTRTVHGLHSARGESCLVAWRPAAKVGARPYANRHTRKRRDRRGCGRPNLPRPSFAWGLAATRRRPPELRNALGLTAPQAVLGAAEEECGDVHQRQHLDVGNRAH